MKQILLSVMLVFLMSSIYSQDPAQSGKNLNLHNQIALDGYDAVAYQTEKKAQKGNPSIVVNRSGVNYYFASEENRRQFLKSPEIFEPVYGGWCAFAMGESGEKVQVDPKTFKIINGRLYLFYNRLFNNTLTEWNKDESNLMKKADVNWKKINQ